MYRVLQRFLHRDFALQLEMHVRSSRQHCAAAQFKSHVCYLHRLTLMLRQDSSPLCALSPDCPPCCGKTQVPCALSSPTAPSAHASHTTKVFATSATTGRLRDGMVQLPMALQGAWPMMPGMGQGSPVYTWWLHQALSATSLKASASPHSVQDLE